MVPRMQSPSTKGTDIFVAARFISICNVEAAWHVPASSRDPKPLAPGQEVAPAVRRHAAKCNRRLIDPREAMAAAGKGPCVTNCATAREMACWVWAIAGMAAA